MRPFTTAAVLGLSLGGWLCGIPGLARADKFGIGWSEYERPLWPGAYLPNDVEPFSHRYNYYAGPAFYFGMDRNRFIWEEYRDRVERAEKFGYAPPPPPTYPVSRWQRFWR